MVPGSGCPTASSASLGRAPSVAARSAARASSARVSLSAAPTRSSSSAALPRAAAASRSATCSESRAESSTPARIGELLLGRLRELGRSPLGRDACLGEPELGLADGLRRGCPPVGERGEQLLELQRATAQLLDGRVELVDLRQLGRHGLVRTLELPEQLEPVVGHQDGVTR